MRALIFMGSPRRAESDSQAHICIPQASAGRALCPPFCLPLRGPGSVPSPESMERKTGGDRAPPLHGIPVINCADGHAPGQAGLARRKKRGYNGFHDRTPPDFGGGRRGFPRFTWRKVDEHASPCPAQRRTDPDRRFRAADSHWRRAAVLSPGRPERAGGGL